MNQERLAEADQARPRPKIIAALAATWLLGVALFPVLGLKAYAASGVFPSGSLPLTVISGLLAYGLWTARPWARKLQMVVLVPMMCAMPFGFAAMILLGYVGRTETRRYFVPSGDGRPWHAAEKWSQSEWPWIIAVSLAFMMGAALLVAMAPLFRAWR